MKNMDYSSCDSISKHAMNVAEVLFKTGLIILISILIVVALIWLPISKTRQALRCE